jgi:putative salt-induced outer membrane protein YdiY
MAAAGIALLPAAARAADTDTVLLRNGDRISGEVKSLDKGRLQLSTNSLSTVYVEWDKVVSLEAVGTYEIETGDGGRFVGRPGPAAPGKMGLALPDGRTLILDIPAVVRMRRIKDVWWRRLSGAISLGASYTKSSSIGQGTLSSNVTFRRPSFEVSTAFDQSVSIEKDQVSSARTSSRSSYYKLLSNRWFVPGVARFERNHDLGYDLRATLGGGVGRFLVQSNRGDLGLAGGLVYNRELPVDGEGSNSVEAFVAANASFYRYDTPKTNLTVGVAGFPSLSDGGRFRLELNSTLSHEIIKDFTVGLTLYDSFDNRPPQEGALKNDVGLSLTIGWTF